MKSVMLFLSILCIGCSNTTSQENIEGENDFYNFYPELKSKVSQLKVHTEKDRIRETLTHYKFVAEERVILSFLSGKGYQKFEDKIQNRTGDWVKCDESFMYLRDLEHNVYPSWWDVSSVKNYTCFLEYYDRPLSRRRALYDRQTRTLYMYTHIAG